VVHIQADAGSSSFAQCPQWLWVPSIFLVGTGYPTVKQPKLETD
jgi:hypothetical protein